MEFKDRVNEIARRFNIVNDPETGLNEDDLMVSELIFLKENKEEIIRIGASSTNKVGRLFMHHCAVGDITHRSRRQHLESSFRRYVAEFFEGRYDPATLSREKQPLLWAMLNPEADEVHLRYKDRPED